MADFTNSVQELANLSALVSPSSSRTTPVTTTRLIPASVFAGGAFTEFPKEAGIAAAALGVGDMSPVRALAEVMGREWRAIGLRGMYGYMADLATEPRGTAFRKPLLKTPTSTQTS